MQMLMMQKLAGKGGSSGGIDPLMLMAMSGGFGGAASGGAGGIGGMNPMMLAMLFNKEETPTPESISRSSFLQAPPLTRMR